MSNPIESEFDLKRKEKLRLQRINKADSVDWVVVNKAIALKDKNIQKELII